MAAATWFWPATQFLRHDQAEEAVLGQGLEILARIDELLVALDGVLAHRSLAEIDQRLLQLFLLVGQQPLRIELEPKAPERFLAPHFDVAHPTALPCIGHDIFVVRAVRCASSATFQAVCSPLRRSCRPGGRHLNQSVEVDQPCGFSWRFLEARPLLSHLRAN